MMENNYHIAWCPFCNQGWVNVIKDLGNKKLLLLCYECDTTWADPNDIALNKPINYEMVGKIEVPLLGEIQEAGWDKFLKPM